MQPNLFLWVLCGLISVAIAKASADKTPAGNLIQEKQVVAGIPIGEVSHDSIQNAIDATFEHDLKFESDRKYETNGELSCMQFGSRMTKKVVPAFLTCTRELQLMRRDLRMKLKHNLPCLVKCIGSKIGFLHGNGSFDESFFWRFLEEEVPRRFQKHATTIWNTCQGYVEMMDGEEEGCGSYKPFFKCVVNTFMHLASDALKLCTDIPDHVQERVTEVIQSNKTRAVIDHYMN